jgi:hypothetical protein
MYDCKLLCVVGIIERICLSGKVVVHADAS